MENKTIDPDTIIMIDEITLTPTNKRVNYINETHMTMIKHYLALYLILFIIMLVVDLIVVNKYGMGEGLTVLQLTFLTSGIYWTLALIGDLFICLYNRISLPELIRREYTNDKV